MTTESFCLKTEILRGRFKLEVDIEVPSQGITALFGRSGCGKTTLLRAFAGLPIDGAQSVFTTLQMKGKPWQPHVGFVFQQGNAFPHLTVEENLSYAWKRAPKNLKVQRLSPASILELTGLTALCKEYPTQLSGGQQQRVALARSLASCPELLLLDEPFANLDEPTRVEFQRLLLTLQQELRVPMLFVSHQVSEVVTVANHMLLMEHGRIVEQGSLSHVLSSDRGFQATRGENIMSGKLVKRASSQMDLNEIEVSGYSFWVPQLPRQVQLGSQCRIHFNAREASIARSHAVDSSINNIVPAKIEEISELESSSELRLCLSLQHDQSREKQHVYVLITQASRRRLNLNEGEDIFIQIKALAVSY